MSGKNSFGKFVFVAMTLILTACSNGIAPVQQGQSTRITQEPISIQNDTATPYVTATFTPIPTVTLTPIPTPTQKPEVTAADIAFPITWEGPYSAKNRIQYAPCYHFDASKFDMGKLTEQNWPNYFHAGDMYNLNSSSPAKSYTVLSLSSGKVVNISDSSPENGTMIVIETNYKYEGKTVYISLAHLTAPFGGDSSFPKIELGSVVAKGQPLGIQSTLYNFGIPEQALDIQFRLNPIAEGYPLGIGWNPNDFLDPYPFIQDDLDNLLQEGHVVFGYNRSHCKLSGHFP